MSNPIVEFFQSNLGKPLPFNPSPLSRWIEAIPIAAEEGNLSFEIVVREEMTNPAGTLHGGAAAAILDDVIGAVVYSMNEPELFTSINLSVDFLSTTRQGAKIHASAQIVRKGRNVVHVIGEIRDIQGKLLAKASSNLIRTEQKKML